MVVYDVMLIGYMIVVEVYENIGINKNMDVGGMKRVVDGVNR